MLFESQITRLPRPFDTDLGAEARAAVPALSGDLAKLIEGTAGSSPYLKSLIHKEAAWLPEALQDADVALAAVFAGLQAGAPDERPTALRGWLLYTSAAAAERSRVVLGDSRVSTTIKNQA